MSDTMPDSVPALIRYPENNPSRNVLTPIEEAKNCLSDLATLYLVTEVAGQSQETLAAKRRALPRFLSFSQDLYGHDRPEEWPPFPLIARRSG